MRFVRMHVALKCLTCLCCRSGVKGKAASCTGFLHPFNP